MCVEQTAARKIQISLDRASKRALDVSQTAAETINQGRGRLACEFCNWECRCLLAYADIQIRDRIG